MYLAIDFGKKRIGLAVGESFAIPKKTIDASNLDLAIRDILAVIYDNDINKIVIGLPKRSQGEAGTIETEIRSFADRLNVASDLPIFFEEEQFTSTEAESRLSDAGISVTRAGGQVDQMAAALILEQHLDRIKSEQVNK
jgi:putative Holliday junction resolvase